VTHSRFHLDASPEPSVSRASRPCPTLWQPRGYSRHRRATNTGETSVTGAVLAQSKLVIRERAA